MILPRYLETSKFFRGFIYSDVWYTGIPKLSKFLGALFFCLLLFSQLLVAISPTPKSLLIQFTTIQNRFRIPSLYFLCLLFIYVASCGPFTPGNILYWQNSLATITAAGCCFALLISLRKILSNYP